jgi:hypothetical protein
MEDETRPAAHTQAPPERTKAIAGSAQAGCHPARTAANGQGSPGG